MTDYDLYGRPIGLSGLSDLLDRVNSLEAASQSASVGALQAKLLPTMPEVGSLALAPALVGAGGDVAITNQGVAILNGAITVKNAGATVVIDGTSNMFKIQATGTLSGTGNHSTSNSNGITQVILSQMAPGGVCPAFLSVVSETGGNQVNASSIVAYFSDMTGVHRSAWITEQAAFGDNPPSWYQDDLFVVLLCASTGDVSMITFSARYYILKEAGI